MLLAALTTHRDIILDKLFDITERYKPSEEEKVRSVSQKLPTTLRFLVDTNNSCSNIEL